MRTKTFVDSLSVHVCSLVKFFAGVVKSPLQYVMVYSVYAQKFVVLKLDLKVALYSLTIESRIDKMSKLLVISISRIPLLPKGRNLQKSLA